MLGFIVRRLLYLVPVLLAVTLLTFFIASLLPGDLAIAMLGDQATPENVAALHKKLGLDLPLWRQYLIWLGNALSGDLGTSHRTGETVAHMIAGRAPVSLEIMILTVIASLVISIPLAIVCSARRDSAFDQATSFTAFGMLAAPPYLLAILLIFLFSVRLRLLPAIGWVPLSQSLLGNLRCMILPVASLALVEWPVLMRVLRSDMIATLQEPFIAMARAKGLKQRRILLVHALKPSSLALVTVAGLNIGRLIGGTVIAEVIFGLPGLGRLLIEAIAARDFVILQGGVVLITVGFVLVNLTVDLLYAVLDPRIRHGNA
jgi:peptide/nickel transport system permease protein